MAASSKHLEQRFRDHTMALFEKHGIINVSYWKPLDQPNTLIYLVAHPSQLAAATAWQAFGNDPEWQRVYAESISDGRLVENIRRTFMLPTDYSPRLGL
ncbi:MAG: NIPSNAP family protein [Candidatus Azotimanducaceae bacterium]